MVPSAISGAGPASLLAGERPSSSSILKLAGGLLPAGSQLDAETRVF